MASGVSVSNECIKAFDDIKLGHKHKYVIFRLSEDLTEVVVVKKADLSETYDDFLNLVKCHEKKCLYAVYDFDYMHNDMPRQKLVFFSWAPDDAEVKQKMLYTSSKNAFRQKLKGISVDMQVNDYSDLEIDEVVTKCCERSQ